MYFVQYFFAGGREHDPRRKEWAEFKCDVCGNKHHLEATASKKDNIRAKEHESIKCPHCGVIDFDDRKKQIESKIARLAESKSKIDIEIEQLLRELESDSYNLYENYEET